MKISLYLDGLLDDLEELKPVSLSDICRFVKNHKTFTSITMHARNSDHAALYLHDLSVCLVQAIKLRSDPSMIDVQLAALVYLISEVRSSRQTRRYDALVSSTSKQTGKYHWSRAMATSSLLCKEVTSEKIRQSA